VKLLRAAAVQFLSTCAGIEEAVRKPRTHSGPDPDDQTGDGEHGGGKERPEEGNIYPDGGWSRSTESWPISSVQNARLCDLP
jgi:hypothetical protein